MTPHPGLTTRRRSLRPLLVRCLALVGLAFLACGPKIDPRLVRHWAAKDFDCDDRVVEVERLEDPARYRARGCGHSNVYDCVQTGENTIRCKPVTTVAGNTVVGVTLPPPSACECAHPHGGDDSNDAPASTTPVMPQKPYRQ